MNVCNVIGTASWAGSAAIFGFQTLSSLMHKDNAWQVFTLFDIGNGPVDYIADRLSEGVILEYYEYLAYDLPLYQLLLAVGLIFFVLGCFSRK